MNWNMVKYRLLPFLVGVLISMFIGKVFDNTSRIKALEDNFKSYQVKMISK